MFSGKIVENDIIFRVTGNGSDRIGMGVLNKTHPKERLRGPESFPFFSLSVIVRGEGSYEDCVTGRRYPVRSGMFFMRQPGVEHIIRIDISSGWLEFFIDLGNFAWPYFRNFYSISEDTPVGNFQADEEWFGEFDFLREQLRHSPEEDLPELFLKLFSLTSRCVKGIIRGGREDAILHDACMYLSSNFTERCDIKEFCRKKGWGYESFRKLFTNRMNVPPNRYRIQRKMDSARAMLVQKEIPIQSIASMLGYCSPYEFSSKFKAFFGVPPSLYRKEFTADTYSASESISWNRASNA